MLGIVQSSAYSTPAESHRQGARPIGPALCRSSADELPLVPTAYGPADNDQIGKVEPVEVHDLVPRGHEVVHELLPRVVARVDLRERPQLGVRRRRRGRRGCAVHLTSPVARSRPSKVSASRVVRRPSTRVPMSSRFTKKSLVSDPGVEVKTPSGDWPEFAPSTRRPPTSTVISRRAQGQQVRAVDQQVLRRQPGARRRGSCGTRPRPARAGRTTRRRSTPASRPCVPAENGTSTSWPALRAACSTAAHPPSTIRSASEILLPPRRESLKRLAGSPPACAARAPASSGSLTSQPRCGSRRMRAPFAPPRLSLLRNVEADAHAVETSWETDRPESRMLALERGDVVGIDELVIHGGDGVLPDQRLGRDQRPEVALDRAHVEVRQLEPDPGERVRQLVRILQEAPRDRLVDRVEPQREVRRQDRRGVGLRRVVGVRHGAGPAAVARDPLPQPGGAQRHVPLVAEQGLEEAVVPPCRGRRPRPFEPAGDGVGARCRCRSCSPSPGPAPPAGRPRVRGRGTAPGRPRRGSCRTCARPRSARRSPRRSSPSGRNVSRMSRADGERVRARCSGPPG